MSRSLLPPRGIFVPSRLIYARNLPPAILQTWVQLRGLAWGAYETPSLSFNQLFEITGKSQSSLYGHLTFLRNWGALRWRPSGTGIFIVSFDPAISPLYPPDANFQDSRNLESADPSLASNHNQDKVDLSREGEFQDSRNLENPISSRPAVHSLEPIDHRSEAGFQDSGYGIPVIEAGGSGRRRGRSRPTKPENEASIRYRRQTGIRPNPAQRQLLATQVTDLELWESAVEHWQSHGWNPKNIAGQLELYQRGGPSACRYCQKEKVPPNQTLEILDQLRKELKYG